MKKFHRILLKLSGESLMGSSRKHPRQDTDDGQEWCDQL